MKPRLLDLFCGAGGVACGYVRAGFEVVGVDNRPMPRYLKSGASEFIQADALEYLVAHGHEFDAIHASPPCQAYSKTRTIHQGKPNAKVHPDLVGPTRDLLIASGNPYVIENVEGSPLIDPMMLCGTYFGLRVKRHRLFESSTYLMAPAVECSHPPRGSFVQTGRPLKEGDWVICAGHISGIKIAGKAMGIDWMNRDELVQAIPPVFTEFIGRQLMNCLATPHTP